VTLTLQLRGRHPASRVPLLISNVEAALTTSTSEKKPPTAIKVVRVIFRHRSAKQLTLTR